MMKRNKIKDEIKIHAINKIRVSYQNVFVAVVVVVKLIKIVSGIKSIF